MVMFLFINGKYVCILYMYCFYPICNFKIYHKKVFIYFICIILPSMNV